MKCKGLHESILIFFLSFILMILMMDRFINSYDEALILVGSKLLNTGQTLYTDFWTMYGPGQYMLTSLLFDLFWVDSLFLRLSDVIFRSLIIVFTYRFVTRFLSKKIALIVIILKFSFLSTIGFHGFPVFPAVAFSLASILLLIDHKSDSFNLKLIFCAGLFIGFATLFRHDLGFYGFISSIVFVILKQLHRCSTKGFRGIKILKPIIILIIGVLSIFIPVALFILKSATLKDLMNSLIVIPGTNYPRMRSLPFPDIFTITSQFISTGDIGIMQQLIVYLPIVISISFIFFIFLKKSHFKCEIKRTDSNLSTISIFFLILTSLFYIKGIVRVHPIHIAPAIIMSTIQLCILCSLCFNGEKIFRYKAIVLIVLAMVCFFPYLSFGLKIVKKNLNSLFEPEGFFSLCLNPKVEMATGMNIDNTRLNLVRFIQNNSLSCDKIFVGAGRHDKIFANDIDIYFLSNRLPATGWFQFEPGVQNSQEVQRSIIKDLINEKPKFIVLNPGWDGANEPNESRLSSGVLMLDEFILSNYRSVKDFGVFKVLQSKNL